MNKYDITGVLGAVPNDTIGVGYPRRWFLVAWLRFIFAIVFCVFPIVVMVLLGALTPKNVSMYGIPLNILIGCIFPLVISLAWLPSLRIQLRLETREKNPVILLKDDLLTVTQGQQTETYAISDVRLVMTFNFLVRKSATLFLKSGRHFKIDGSMQNYDMFLNRLKELRPEAFVQDSHPELFARPKILGR